MPSCGIRHRMPSSLCLWGISGLCFLLFIYYYYVNGCLKGISATVWVKAQWKRKRCRLISSWAVSPCVFHAGGALCRLPSVRQLDLSCNKGLSGTLERLCPHFAHLAQLESLDLHLCSLTRCDLNALSEFVQLMVWKRFAGDLHRSEGVQWLTLTPPLTAQSRCCPSWRRWRSLMCHPIRPQVAWCIHWSLPFHCLGWGDCRSTAAAWMRSLLLHWVRCYSTVYSVSNVNFCHSLLQYQYCGFLQCIICNSFSFFCIFLKTVHNK